MRGADAQFGHGTHPERRPRFAANVAHAQALRQSAHPLQLQIHNPAGAHFDRPARERGIVDAFIETHGRAHARLQQRGAFQVILRQRLLEHHELVLVQLFEDGKIVARVIGICVHEQRHIAEFSAHRTHQRDILAALDFDFQPVVALRLQPMNGCKQLLLGIVEAYRQS